MKPLMFMLIFLFAGTVNAGGWQAIGDIEHLGKLGKTVRSLTKISNVLKVTPSYHGNPSAGVVNRTVGNIQNVPTRQPKLQDIPYLIQEGQSILRLSSSFHGH